MADDDFEVEDDRNVAVGDGCGCGWWIGMDSVRKKKKRGDM